MAAPDITWTTTAEQWHEAHRVRPQPWIRTPSSRDGYNVDFEQTLEFGQRLQNPLETEKVIGTGGQLCTVVRMRHTKTGSVYVVKQFVVPPSSHDEAVQQMQTEIDILRYLSHYHIVQILGSYTEHDQFGLLLQPATCDLGLVLSNFARADDTRQKIQNQWMTELHKFLPSISGCLARALTYIHKQKIRHKDIKPANILFDGRCVMFADFGISRKFATVSGSSGITGRTEKYAPPEILDGEYHNRSQDIFSLGCVFAEIFAFYKRRPVKELHDQLGPDRRYATSVQSILDWMQQHLKERCDAQFYHLVKKMLSVKSEERPVAAEVWLDTTIMASGSDKEIHFCGACCMPQVSKNEKSAQGVAKPDPLVYQEPLVSVGRARDDFRNDSDFDTVYSSEDHAAFDWNRNLRIGNQSILDVVRTSKLPHPICRKRVWPRTETLQDLEEARAAAKAEADILKRLVHRHIVQLEGTYLQGRCFALMIMPVADYELRYYLTLAECEAQSIDVSTTLREAFGCLSNALKYLHQQNVVHGDIKSKNVLICNGRIFLAEFGFASSQKRKLYMQHTFHGHGEDEQGFYQANPYRAPEVSPPKNVSTPADIYSLGCVFLEIETIRRGRKLHQLESFRSASKGQMSGWIEELGMEDHKTSERFYGLLRDMVAQNPGARPNAALVLEEIHGCLDKQGKPLCGIHC